MKTLYSVTGDIKDINTVLVNLNDLRQVQIAAEHAIAYGADEGEMYEPSFVGELRAAIEIIRAATA